MLNDDKWDEEKKRAFLLTSLSIDTLKLVTDALFPKLSVNCTYKEILELLEDLCKPIQSIFECRDKFYREKQSESESIRDFASRLKNLCTDCSFQGRLDANLKDIFVTGIYNIQIKQKLFLECEKDKVDYAQCFKIASAYEHILNVGKSEESVYVASGSRERENIKNSKYINPKALSDSSRSSSSSKNSGSKLRGLDRNHKNVIAKRKEVSCFSCGENHFKSECKFKNAKCRHCGKIGHISKICYKLQNTILHNVDDNNKNYIFLKIQVRDKPHKGLLDSGASISAIPKSILHKLFGTIKIEPCDLRLCSFDGSKLQICGSIELKIKYGNKTKRIKFIVTKEGSNILLGIDFMKMFDIGFSNVGKVNVIHKDEIVETDNEVFIKKCQSDFPNVFKGTIGSFKGFKANIRVKESYVPKYVNARPVPYNIREKVEVELNKMVREGIIEPIKCSNTASPMVIVKKQNGKIRVCADFKRTLNPMLEKTSYPIPRIEDLLSTLSKGKIFSKLDLKDAFAQVRLNEKSQKYCVLSTHIGLFKYKVLPYGLASSPSSFANVVNSVMSGVKGVITYFDDILIIGEDLAEHNRNLRAALERLNDAGLTINCDKSLFHQEAIEYLGFRVDAHGVKPLASKIDAIVKMPEPTNVSEVRAFIGSLNFYRMFVKNMSTILAPLYELLKKNSSFVWSEECKQAFRSVKQILSSDKVLCHYDNSRPVKLICDASDKGISAILVHLFDNNMERPIAYASRTLSQAERKYCILDKESLAIVFGVKKFFQYLYGTKFTLECDNKALVHIFAPDKDIPTLANSRLQRFALILSTFDYEIAYVKSQENRADVFSRLPIEESTEFGEEECRVFENIFNINVEQENINFIVDQCELSVDLLKKSVSEDACLKVVMDYIQGNKWPDKKHLQGNSLKWFYLKDQLSVYDNCMFYQNRLVIPESLREKILLFLHESHLGITKSKSLGRNYFFWLGFNSHIEETIKNCEICSENASTPKKLEISSWPIDTEIWKRLHLDFFGPIGNKYFLIIIDPTSKWLECLCVTGLDSNQTIRELKILFSHFGIVEVLVSDNGPAFRSREFEKFCSEFKIKHLTSAVKKPNSNGQAEVSVKFVKTFLKKLLHEGRLPQNFLDKLLNFLVDYRNAPHQSTGISPSEALLGHRIRSRFDTLFPSKRNDTRAYKNVSSEVAVNMKRAQTRQVSYSKGRKFNKSLEIGTKVMAKDFRSDQNKWRRGEIIKKIGTRVYLVKMRNSDQVWKRHADQLIEKSVRWEDEATLPEKQGQGGGLSGVSVQSLSDSVSFSNPMNPWRGRLRARI